MAMSDAEKTAIQNKIIDQEAYLRHLFKTHVTCIEVSIDCLRLDEFDDAHHWLKQGNESFKKVVAQMDSIMALKKQLIIE